VTAVAFREDGMAGVVAGTIKGQLLVFGPSDVRGL